MSVYASINIQLYYAIQAAKINKNNTTITITIAKAVNVLN